MKQSKNASIVLLIIIIVYIIRYVDTNSEVRMVEAKTNEKFLVRNLPDKEKAADMLSEISKKLIELVEHLNKNKTKFEEYEKCINLINKRFNPSNMSEGNLDFKYTTYTVNKGEKMVFCLRQRKTEELHKLNLVLFVAIHELSHIGSESVDHTDEFYKNNKFLLQQAISCGIYTPEKFNKNPVNYCGIDITHEPI